MYEVEDDVPMPPAPRIPGAAAPKYPFAQMKVGSSFVVPTEKARGNALCAGNSFSCTAAGRGMKFASRKQADGTYRIWRIA